LSNLNNDIDHVDGKIQKIYNFLLSASEKTWASYLLFVVSFTESCIFIIPPEVMLLPMVYANRKKAWKYAFITSIASVLGAIAGYYLGMYFWDMIAPLANQYIHGFQGYFDIVGKKFEENATLALFLAAFTPIPFKVFTVASGVYSAKISLGLLVGLSLVGRSSRYFLLSGIVYVFGPKAHEIIEKHFKIATLVIATIGILAIILKLNH